MIRSGLKRSISCISSWFSGRMSRPVASLPPDAARSLPGSGKLRLVGLSFCSRMPSGPLAALSGNSTGTSRTLKSDGVAARSFSNSRATCTPCRSVPCTPPITSARRVVLPGKKRSSIERLPAVLPSSLAPRRSASQLSSTPTFLRSAAGSRATAARTSCPNARLPAASRKASNPPAVARRDAGA